MELWVAGDPISDVYHLGRHCENRFNIEKTIWRPGGASNTFENLKSIVGNQSKIQLFRASRTPVDNYLELTRLVDLDTGKTIEFFPCKTPVKEFFYYSSLSKDGAFGAYQSWFSKDIKCLVASDYNKGTLNKWARLDGPPKGAFVFGLLDSRYRTLHPGLLDLCQIRIWHATSTEYTHQYAQNFDWIMHTNGPNNVWIGPGHSVSGSSDWTSLPVPADTPVVDVTGAGDTFTAAAAAHLMTANAVVNIETLAAAARFAIECCQEVIQVQYSAVTTKKV